MKTRKIFTSLLAWLILTLFANQQLIAQPKERLKNRYRETPPFTRTCRACVITLLFIVRPSIRLVIKNHHILVAINLTTSALPK